MQNRHSQRLAVPVVAEWELRPDAQCLNEQAESERDPGISSSPGQSSPEVGMGDGGAEERQHRQECQRGTEVSMREYPQDLSEDGYRCQSPGKEWKPSGRRGASISSRTAIDPLAHETSLWIIRR